MVETLYTFCNECSTRLDSELSHSTYLFEKYHVELSSNSNPIYTVIDHSLDGVKKPLAQYWRDRIMRTD